MESINVTKFENDPVQDKKLDHYDWKPQNFLAGQELTVTITLGEYRDLVSSKATAEQAIRASSDKTAKAEAELKEARAEAERLKAENYDLQNKLMSIQGSKDQRPMSYDEIDKMIHRDQAGGSDTE